LLIKLTVIIVFVYDGQSVPSFFKATSHALLDLKPGCAIP